jgi:hypothetical protein
MASAGLGLDEPTRPDEILDALEQHTPAVTKPAAPRLDPERDGGGDQGDLWVEPDGDAIGDRLRRHHERWQNQPAADEPPRGSAQLSHAYSANTPRRTPRRAPRTGSRSWAQRPRGGRLVLALAAVIAVAVAAMLMMSSTAGSPQSARGSATHRMRTTAAVNTSAVHSAAAAPFAFVDRLNTRSDDALRRVAHRVNQRAAEQQARERARERHQKAVADKRARARKRAEARKRADAQAHAQQSAGESTTAPSQSYTPTELSPSTVATTPQSSEPTSKSSSSSSSSSAGPTGVGGTTGGCNPQCH